MTKAKLTIAPTKFYNFVPQPDITPLEAAWIAYFFAIRLLMNMPEDFEAWPLIERHFKEVTTPTEGSD